LLSAMNHHHTKIVFKAPREHFFGQHWVCEN
jgi:hypothetical protein